LQENNNLFNISGWEIKKGPAKEFLFPSFVCYFVQLLGTSKNEDHTVRGLQREKTFTYGLRKQPNFATPPLVCPQNDVGETSAEIPQKTTCHYPAVWVVLLIG